MRAEESLIAKLKEGLKEVERHTGMNGYFFVSIVLLGFCFIFFGWFDRLITNVIGVIYPTLYTLELLSRRSNSAVEQKTVLIYWSLFGLLSLADTTLSVISRVIPFYNLIKSVSLIWLFFPNFQGTSIVYGLFLKHIFSRYEDKLHQATGKIEDTFNSLLGMTN